MALIDWLWESLDPAESGAEMRRREAAWAAEAESRLAAVRRGEMEPLDGEEVLASLREELKARRR